MFGYLPPCSFSSVVYNPSHKMTSHHDFFLLPSFPRLLGPPLLQRTKHVYEDVFNVTFETYTERTRVVTS